VSVLRIPEERKKRSLSLFVGPSGVGKGYGLGDCLAEYHGLLIFVSGDWCRKHEKEHANKGIRVDNRRIVDAGIECFESRGRPDRFGFDCPRDVVQIQMLREYFDRAYGDYELLFWHMHAKKDICEQRIHDRAIRQGRLDDADPVAIARRVKTYFDAETGLCKTLVPYVADECDGHIDLDANGNLETEVRPRVITELAPMFYPPFELVAA
jgi:adenylate kinase family enzyme